MGDGESEGLGRGAVDGLDGGQDAAVRLVGVLGEDVGGSGGGDEAEGAAEAREEAAGVGRGGSGRMGDRGGQSRLEQAIARLRGDEPAGRAFAEARGQALSADHLRLTDAARGGATVEVTPVLPADVIGLYVLLPEGE